MKKITLLLDYDHIKRLKEIQAYFGWGCLESAVQFSLLTGIREIEEVIKFDKENKGK